MSIVLQDVEPGSHVVHFYADDCALASSVAGYAAEGLDAGEAVVLIVEPAHLAATRCALRARGLDPDAGPARGIHLLDTAPTLRRIMEDGLPAPDRFADALGDLLSSALPGHAGVRAYGEMVETLWRRGNVAAALALEELWNEIAREFPITLYCAYKDTLVAGTTDASVLDDACRLHSAVVGDGALSLRSSAYRRFVAEEDAPAAARAFVLATLECRDAPLAADAALVVSELATNAVRYGGAGFSVTLSCLAQGVRISVRDSGPELPSLRSSSPFDPGGRGLPIVDALCPNWGTTRRHDGKVVWAELDR